jgi:hypothetical protein
MQLTEKKHPEKYKIFDQNIASFFQANRRKKSKANKNINRNQRSS